MAPFFCGGFDALTTPLMNGRDEASAEESKEADPSLLDMEHVTEMSDPHGVMVCGNKMQAVAQSQHDVSPTTWDVFVPGNTVNAPTF